MDDRTLMFQSPRGDFGFLKCDYCKSVFFDAEYIGFQSPRGDFGFLKGQCWFDASSVGTRHVSIPSRGFWFFEDILESHGKQTSQVNVSIPSRGFWFFEEPIDKEMVWTIAHLCFNPLAGILVF